MEHLGVNEDVFPCGAHPPATPMFAAWAMKDENGEESVAFSKVISIVSYVTVDKEPTEMPHRKDRFTTLQFDTFSIWRPTDAMEVMEPDGNQEQFLGYSFNEDPEPWTDNVKEHFESQRRVKEMREKKIREKNQKA